MRFLSINGKAPVKDGLATSFSKSYIKHFQYTGVQAADDIEGSENTALRKHNASCGT